MQRFVLRDPCTKAPLPNTPYRLFTEGDGFLIHGTTDAAGQTIEVLVPKGITEKDIQLVPVVGEGNFGKNFVLRYKGDALAVLGVQYRISMGRRVVAEGYSDEHGNTKYVQSKRPRKLVLEVRDGQCPNSPDSED